jgi:hypothetical protein
MTMRVRNAGFFLGLLAVVAMFVACGGGGEGSSQSSAPAADQAYMLSWEAPAATIDNTTIDPYEELDHYEVYVSETGTFTDEDAPVALVSAVEDALSTDGAGSRKLVTEFDLALLAGLPSAQQLYVSLRAVGADGQKSDFMDPVAWTRS